MTNISPLSQTPELVALGAAVRRLRKERQLTQEELAHASGVHISYVGAIERGQNNPAWLTLVKLARALDVTVQQLATEAAN